MTTATTPKKQICSEIPVGWEQTCLSDAVDVNPVRVLKKGATAKFVSMADLKERNKKIVGYEQRAYSGGSKFVNGDTLMARITPCLENGKTAFVDFLHKDEVGSGSTEFIVLCGRKDRSTNHFAYYLATSPDIRGIAIKSMIGTSGRQRVETDVFKKVIINLPFLPEQRAIAKILGDLDGKIELNHRMNKTLEAIAQVVFKRWFVDFEFPDDCGRPYQSSGGKMVDSELGEIPDGWQISKLGNFAEILNGFAFKSEDFISTGVFLLRTRNFTEDGYIMRDDTACLPESFYDDYKGFRLKKFDVLLVMVGASVGKMAMVQSSVLPALQNQNMWNFRSKDDSGQLFLNYLVKKIVQENIGAASGSARDFFRKDYFREIYFILPNKKILKKFNESMEPFFSQLDKNLAEIEILSKTRDSLLPKLMSGKIRVKDNLVPADA